MVRKAASQRPKGSKVSTKAISVDGSGATVSGGVYAGQEKIDGYRVHFYGASLSSFTFIKRLLVPLHFLP